MRTCHLILLVTAAACARGPQMGVAPHRPDSIGPAEGKSLVLVVRPHAYFGKAIGTSLYDGDEFVGLLTDNAVVAHQAEPGKHVFMLLSGQPAAAAFLEGELLGGTTYLIEVAPRSSWTRPPFHLIPVNPNRRGAGVDKTLSTGSLLVMNEQARRWDQENHTSVMRKKAEAMPNWQDDPGRMIIPSNFGASPWTGTTIFSSAGPKQSKSESTSDTKPAESPTSTSDKTRPAEPSTRLEQLERLRQQGLVTEDEYREKRRRIIEEF